MKVLMVSLPFSGHVNPTLGMAKALVRKGHTVDFILTKQWQAQIEQTGASFIPYENFPQEPSAWDLRRLSFKAACETALKFGKGYDCLVYEMLFFPGKAIADMLNIPAIRLFSTFALNDNILSNITKTGGPLMGLLKSKTIAKAMTKRMTGNVKIQEDTLLKEITQNPPECNFVFTTKEFQIDADAFPGYQFLGPSIQGRKELPFTELNDLHTPIIYISLGSMLNNAKKFYRNCIKAFKDTPYTVILSVGKKVDIRSLGELPDNIHVFAFVPQLQVLKKATLFLTHGGMNSVNEAIYFGVPMVVIPLATDQPTVAGRICELNLGKQIKITANSEEIYKASTFVIDNKEIKDSIKRFMTYAQQARGTSYAADKIEDFIKMKHQQKEKG